MIVLSIPRAGHDHRSPAWPASPAFPLTFDHYHGPYSSIHRAPGNHHHPCLAGRFQSVASTCGRIYAIWHRSSNTSAHFHSYTYYERMTNPSVTIGTAFDLITRIAVERIAARYVRDADFRADSFFIRGRPREFNPDVNCDGTPVRLLADSPYLEQAGLYFDCFLFPFTMALIPTLIIYKN